MQKMEAVGQLTGGIAHDFNNMMAVVISSLRLMQRRLERGDTNIQEYTDGALRGAERAANLTRRLLAFSRQQPLAPETVDANKLIAGMEDVLRRTIPASISIETVFAGGLWRTRADAQGLESALLNLAVNARDAMPDGGKLTIETSNAFLDEAYAASHAEVAVGQYVLLAVTDTGSGMAPAVVSRAFDPFFTTKPTGEGTGLGLSQVYGFIKQSGGHVKIYSEVGVGTTVKLYLPRLASSKETETDARPPGPVGHTDGQGQVVLVVEDDTDVRRLTVDMLEELNYVALSAEGGARALAIHGNEPARSPAAHRHRHARHERQGAGRGGAKAAARPQGAVHDRLHPQRHRAQRGARPGGTPDCQTFHPRGFGRKVGRNPHPRTTRRSLARPRHTRQIDRLSRPPRWAELDVTADPVAKSELVARAATAAAAHAGNATGRDALGIPRRLGERHMKTWHKPEVTEQEVGLEVTSYLPAELDRD